MYDNVHRRRQLRTLRSTKRLWNVWWGWGTLFLNIMELLTEGGYEEGRELSRVLIDANIDTSIVYVRQPICLQFKGID